MKHWEGHIWSTEYTTYQALNILHMKHWGGTEVDSTNLVLILHFSKILMGSRQIQKKRHRFCNQRYHFLGWLANQGHTGGPISWSAKRQATPAMSKCEAEYMALSETREEALWLRYAQGEFH